MMIASNGNMTEWSIVYIASPSRPARLPAAVTAPITPASPVSYQCAQSTRGRDEMHRHSLGGHLWRGNDRGLPGDPRKAG